MSRYTTMFSRLKSANEGAFVPFVTLGDPDLESSEKVIDALVQGGADALELGLPFSDPVADGPVIQAANFRSLAAGITVANCFSLLKRVRDKYPDLPIGLLVYCNLVHANGVEHFFKLCAEVGVDSVLIADVPMRESSTYRDIANTNGVESVYICPPDATADLRKQVAQNSQGYVYLLSRAGVTGTGDTLQKPATEAIAELQQANSSPPLLGFGISSPEHVRTALESGAAGAISGSAVVKIIADNLGNEVVMLEQLTEFTASMKAATRS